MKTDGVPDDGMPLTQVPKQRLYTECPTPKKSRFATMEAAEAAVRKASFELNKALYTYDTCPCGWIHLTSKLVRVNQVPAATSLALLGDMEFAKIVQDDVKKVAHPDDSAALRHPENLQRWRAALRRFGIEMEKQLVSKSDDKSADAKEWRKRASVVRLSIASTFDECTSLINQVRIENTQKKRQEKDQRHEAGERAIDRLIAAHQIEFQEYLAEECERLGVELPKRIRRYLELERLKSSEQNDVPRETSEADDG